MSLPALVALGSNIPPRRATLDAALDGLAALPDTELLAASRWFETEPVDAPPGSGPFLNGAALLHTELAPHALLAELLRLEARAGRTRSVPNAPRRLDLDLILHGDHVLQDAALTLPHPRAHERLFVLEPAVQVAPELRHPVLHKTLAELRDALRRDAGVSFGAVS